MDHDLAVRNKMTERYLLDELDPAIRDEFEAHFFDCQDCARDVGAGVTFVDQSKIVLGEESVVVPDPAPILPTPPSRSIWLGWLRPAFAAPLLTLLLAVVGYQNLVVFPRLSQPQVLPMTTVNIGTFSADDQAIPISAGQGFLLLVRIPQDSGYTQYKAHLQDPSGNREGLIVIPAMEGHDRWPVQFPAASRQPGTYTFVVYGVSANGESKEIGRKSFELQLQQ